MKTNDITNDTMFKVRKGVRTIGSINPSVHAMPYIVAHDRAMNVKPIACRLR